MAITTPGTSAQSVRHLKTSRTIQVIGFYLPVFSVFALFHL
ncbi:hypothetical protein [uncultured Exiguobacterium sp.]|nr:hypothetical protein [uncultured Exiguobacterium sp.]